MTRLLIVGGGGHGAVVAEAAFESGRWSDIVFLDDNPSESRVLEFSIIGKVSEMAAILNANTDVLIAIGDNERRLNLLDLAKRSDGTVATLIHPAACVSRSAMISSGTVVCVGAIVNARASIGSACILNTGATIDHDCTLGDGVHISPGANLAGGVRVGDCSWVGIGASVREGINIGQKVIVGTGAAVVSDVDDGATVVGVPAGPLKTK